MAKVELDEQIHNEDSRNEIRKKVSLSSEFERRCLCYFFD